MEKRIRWKSLKVGDVVKTYADSTLLLIKRKRYKQKYEHYTVYWQHGLLLNLETGETKWTDLDDRTIYGVVIRSE